MKFINTTTLVVTATLFVIGLAGCSKPADAPQTVSWYGEHKTERETKVKWCSDDVTRAVTADCSNALKAQQHARLTAPGSLDSIKFDPNWKPNQGNSAAGNTVNQ